MAATTSEVKREDCLVKIGNTGRKTHRGYVEYVIQDESKPWQRRKVVGRGCYCLMIGGVGRLAHKVVAYPGTDPTKATCEHCSWAGFGISAQVETEG